MSDSICRTCMGKSKQEEILNIFDLKDSMMISTRIMSIVNIKIYPNDGLPHGICGKCVNRLDQCVEFVQLCEKSDIELRALFCEFNNENSCDKVELVGEDTGYKESKENVVLEVKCEYSLKIETEAYNMPETTMTSLKNESEDCVADEKHNASCTSDYDAPLEVYVNRKKKKIKCKGKSQNKRKKILKRVHRLKKADVLETSDQDESLQDLLEAKKKRGRPRTKIPGTKQIRPLKQCSVCGKFVLDSSMRSHIRTHTGERPYSCEHCGKSFCENSALKQHLRRHTGERPYICPTCGESFAHPAGLSIHSTKHTGERPFKCNICPKAYISKTSLNYHIKTHAGTYEFACDVCDRRFNAKSSLKIHQVTHTGEKPYSCTECGKCFGRKGHVDRHSYTAHRILACIQCPAKFSNKDEYDQHRKTHGYRDSSSSNKKSYIVNGNAKFISSGDESDIVILNSKKDNERNQEQCKSTNFNQSE